MYDSLYAPWMFSVCSFVQGTGFPNHCNLCISVVLYTIAFTFIVSSSLLSGRPQGPHRTRVPQLLAPSGRKSAWRVGGVKIKVSHDMNESKYSLNNGASFWLRKTISIMSHDVCPSISTTTTYYKQVNELGPSRRGKLKWQLVFCFQTSITRT